MDAASEAGVGDMVLLVKAAGVSDAGGAVSLDGALIAYRMFQQRVDCYRRWKQRSACHFGGSGAMRAVLE